MQQTMVTDAEMGGPPPMYQEQEYREMPGQREQQIPQQQIPQQLPPPPSYPNQMPNPTAIGRGPEYESTKAQTSKTSEQMLPCVVPQTTMTWKGPYNCPFVRAYPHGLAQHGIDEATFLSFIDSVNESFVTSPVFYVAGTAGHIMSMAYGVHPVQYAGMGLSAASTIAGGVTSYLRTRHVFKKANTELFRPHGLTATVLTTKKLAQMVKYPHEKLQLLPINHFDQSGSDSSSSSSSSDSDSDSDSDYEDIDDTKNDNAPPVSTQPGEQVLTRRMQGLNGYVQPLKFNVPPSEQSENLLRRMGEWQAKRLAAKQQRRLDRNRSKGFMKHDKMERKARKKEIKMEGKMAKLEFKLQQAHSPGKAAKIQAKMERKSAKGERKVEKKHAKGRRKLDKRVNKKEQKTANRIRWIVVTEWDGDAREEPGDEEVLVQDEDEALSAHEVEFVEQKAKERADVEKTA